MYRVIHFFTDLHDESYPYNVGDTFPRAGVEVSEKRLKELSGSANKQGCPLIELVAEDDIKTDVAKAVRATKGGKKSASTKPKTRQKDKSDD